MSVLTPSYIPFGKIVYLGGESVYPELPLGKRPDVSDSTWTVSDISVDRYLPEKTGSGKVKGKTKGTVVGVQISVGAVETTGHRPGPYAAYGRRRSWRSRTDEESRVYFSYLCRRKCPLTSSLLKIFIGFLSLLSLLTSYASLRFYPVTVGPWSSVIVTVGHRK